jgi:hypothetical protein
MNDMKTGIEFMLRAHFGRLPVTEDELQWLTLFLNETPCSGKDLKGYVLPGREIFNLIS